MRELSSDLATMDPVAPYAIDAKRGIPGPPVIARDRHVRRRCDQIIGMDSLITIAEGYWQWRDPRLAAMVLDSADLNMVTWEQGASAGMVRY